MEEKNRRKPPARPSHLLGSGAGGSAVLRQLLGLLWGVMAVFFGNLMMNQCMYRCSSFLGKKNKKHGLVRKKLKNLQKTLQN